MKRGLVLLLVSVLVLQMVGCQLTVEVQNKSEEKEQVTSEEKVDKNEEKAEKKEESSEDTQKTDETKAEGTGETSATTPGQVPSQTPNNKPTVNNNTSTGTQEVVLEKVEVPDVPEIKQEIQTNSSHSALSTASYYQYSSLSSPEKAVYNDLCNAMKNCEVSVKLGGHKCSTETATKAYYAVIADYPQFFYMAKGFAYTYKSNNQIDEFILMYCDGQAADEIDGQGKLVPKADRNKIGQQIGAFNSTVSGILSSIPTSLNAEEKEKRIYDYIQDTVTYDKQTANSGNTTSHSYDAYGAACNKKAVCEGYAELFQYLCYCVGINATPISGTAKGGAHMWDAVEIDSEWYMVDATWDDLQDNAPANMHGYNYFNITEQEMSRDHSADKTILRVPPCVKQSHEFYKTHALFISSLSSVPSNYRQVIDNMVANGDKYLCIYIGNQNGDFSSYLSNFVFGSVELQAYLQQKGVSLKYDCLQVDKYLYISRQ